ncbi:ZIP family metal transporter [Nocardia fluminea]|uniref:ZIP family metal transporter n=1 Tax=Nocardia fluminea TaxID=134984 RepID=UPI0038303EAB
MPILGWIIVSGLAMSTIALLGAVTLLVPESVFARMVTPLVALAAGALLGGAMFHMLPESVSALGNSLTPYTWAVAGVLFFHVLEQFLHWHHCHRPVSRHRPVGYMILIADALHNLLGGMAVAGAFVIDTRLGVVTWLIAAAHEIPQELGDFGILVHSGWKPRTALLYNTASALTFPAGGLLAYALADRLDLTVLVAFAAGNFIYIALADLIPEITTAPAPRAKLLHTTCFTAGLAALWAIAVIA